MPTQERIDIVVTSRGTRRVRRDISAIGTSATVSQGAVKLLRRALVGIGGIVILTGVIRTLASFSQEMSTVRAVTQATGDDFVRLRDRAKELGATTRFSATQAAEGMTFLARAGFNTNQVFETIGGTLQLAQAGALGLGRAADIASNILKGFNLEAEEMTRVIDVLVLSANSANTNVEQLGQAMSFVAPAAAAVGVSVEQASAAVGALSDAGVQSTRAGTALRQIFVKLLDPTSKAQRVFRSLGIATSELNITQRGLIPVLETLASANLRLEQAAALVGVRQAANLLILTKSVPKIEQLSAANEKAAGTAKRVADIMDDNLNGALLAVRSAAEAVVLAFGEIGADKFLTQFMLGLADALRFVARNMEEITQVITVLGALFIGLKLQALVVLFTSLGATILPLVVAGFTAMISPLGIVVALTIAVFALTRSVTQLKKEERDARGVLESINQLRREAAMATGEQAEAIREVIRANIEAKKSEISLALAHEKAVVDILHSQQAQVDLYDSIIAKSIIAFDTKKLKNAQDETAILTLEMKELNKALEDVGKTPEFGKPPPITPPPNRIPGVGTGDGKTFEILLRQLRDEGALLRLNTAARAERQSVLDIEDELNRKLTMSEATQVEQVAALNFQLGLQRELLDSIHGPQEVYEQNIKTINRTLESGLITQTQATEAMRDAQIAVLESQNTIVAGLERGILKAQRSIEDFATIAERVLTNAFRGAEDAFVEFVKTGKFSFQSLVDSMIEQLARLAANQIFANLFAAGLSFFTGSGPNLTSPAAGAAGARMAHGGSFTVGAGTASATIPSAGIDNRLIQFLARDGERVSVSTPGRSPAGSGVSVTIVNNVQADVSTRSSRDGNGKINLEVLIDEAAALAVSTPGSATQRALQGSMGVGRRPVNRG